MPEERQPLNSNASSQTFLGRLTSVLGAMGAVLPVLSIVIYLIVRSGYDGFYGSFGVTPEEAGIGQAEMISNAALALGYITLALLALLVVVIPWLVPVRRSSDWRAFLFFTLALFMIGFLLSFRERAQIGFGSTLGLISISYMFRTAILYNRHDREREGKPRKPGLWQRFHRSGLEAPILSLVLVLVVIGAVEVEGQFSRTGRTTMERAARGEPLTPTWFGFAVNLRARPVEVIWLGDARALLS